MKTSAALLAFYLAYAEWLETEDCSFHPGYGLCANLYDFYMSRDEEDLYESTFVEMHKQFIIAGLDQNLPFNVDIEHYQFEKHARKCHCNLQRIDWVKARIAEAKNG